MSHDQGPPTMTTRNFNSLVLTTLGCPMCKSAPRAKNLHIVWDMATLSLVL